jgi:hypothetical protein
MDDNYFEIGKNRILGEWNDLLEVFVLLHKINL